MQEQEVKNYSINVNLTKLRGAVVTNIKGRTATKLCVIIPVDEAGLYMGEKGAYLDLTAYYLTEPKYNETHMLKQKVDKNAYLAMGEEEKRQQPIIGGMRPLVAAERSKMEASTSIGASSFDSDDDLPF